MPLKPVPMVLERGKVSFHNCLTFHGSGPNRSARPRIAVTMHLQDRDNHHQHATGEDGRPRMHSNDRLCRKLPSGDPDYGDPAVCPVLWESASQ
jgi:ectoine hydroxylase-related dioxygenase (phytanoyl-CoA dioxygenase family)